MFNWKYRCNEARHCGEPGVFCGCRCACGAGIVVVLVLLLGLAVQLIWNWLMPSIFTAAGTIGYAQALGLLVLARLLFGGFGCRTGGHYHVHGKGWHEHGECCPTDNAEDWRHYEEWWESEGKEFFKKYSEKKNKETPTA
jgi:hypothetical protein